MDFIQDVIFLTCHFQQEKSVYITNSDLEKCKNGAIVELRGEGLFRVDTGYTPDIEEKNTVILFKIPNGTEKDLAVSSMTVDLISIRTMQNLYYNLRYCFLLFDRIIRFDLLHQSKWDSKYVFIFFMFLDSYLFSANYCACKR